MGLFNKFKEVDEFISGFARGSFKCNICGMLSKNQQAIRNHVAEFHNEYVFYKNKYGKIPKIATATWINVYYKILYTPPKDWSDERFSTYTHITKNQSMPNIVESIGRVLIDGKFAGYTNPTLGKNPIFNDYANFGHYFKNGKMYNFYQTSDEISKALQKGKVSQYTFNRVPTFKATLSNSNQRMVEFLIRFREGGFEGRRLNDKRVYTREIAPTEGLTYGYSPLDFIPDVDMFIELDNALTKAFNIYSDFKDRTVIVFFNKNNEPCIQARIGRSLYLEHRMVDRIKLAKEAQEIEKACFTDKGLDDFIDFERNYVKNNKDSKGVENIKKWLNAVDKLMELRN